jgi:ATP-dependent Clp protease ATP-binding subunit ClpX
VKAILVGLLRACDFDVERAQNGIIYLDEVDKIAAAGDSNLDVGGESVQEELLTILEGTIISVPKDGNKRSQGESIEIDTTNILFILGGAFGKLGEIVARRKRSEKSAIGFGADVQAKETDFSHHQKDAQAKDYIDLGFLAEFIGRLPIRLTVETLTVEQLERILVEPKKALVTQKVLLLSSTTDLRFTKGALRAIAEEARKAGTNGRALREIMEEVLAPVIFDEPKLAIVDADMVKNRKAETEARNKLEAGKTAAYDSSNIIEDGDVEAVREQAEASAREGNKPDRRVPALAQKQVG